MAHFDIRNFMEDVVLQRMNTIYKTMPDICKCERCHLDRLALALNKVPPRYVVSPKGQIYARLDALSGQVDADVVRAVTDAIVVIGNNPNHDNSDMDF